MKRLNLEAIGCGIYVFIFSIYSVVAWWSVDTILSWFDKDIPFWADIIIGLVANAVAFPVAIIGTILKMFI